MKKRMDIVLRSVDDVKEFAGIAGRMEGQVALSSGRYMIDAKSAIGIFTLNLSAPVHLEIENWREEYGRMLEPYLI